MQESCSRMIDLKKSFWVGSKIRNVKIRMKWRVVAEGILLIILAYITVQVIQHDTPQLLHSIDLVFHEAGHTMFFFLGNFMQLLGGTLMQVLVPILLGLRLWLLCLLVQPTSYGSTIWGKSSV